MESVTPITPKVITVSQLNNYIKSLLDGDQHLSTVFLSGEISNLTNHYKSGHIYLSIKDEKSIVRAVMFAGNARNLKFAPKDGMKILAFGRVSVYPATGQYQFYIEDMQPDGVGALYQAYEDLKEKLQKMGLFDAKYKKPIPQYPKTVGVITSPTGAAVQDIRNILFRRFPSVNMVLYPVLVQGENAPEQLIKAVETFNEYMCADVLIIGRGGGSIEDLWAFNSEDLAKVIFNSEIPVISAVGHETDFTICDFVSDLRAPTPSAAAELAVPDRTELIESLLSQQQYISTIIDNKINNSIKELRNDYKTIYRFSPQNRIKLMESDLNNMYSRSKERMNLLFTKASKDIEKCGAKVEALNPVAVLNRGYAGITKDNKSITSVKEVNIDDVIDLRVSDGTFSAKVVEK